MNPANLPTLLQQFFTDRLSAQMEASPNTIAGYWIATIKNHL